MKSQIYFVIHCDISNRPLSIRFNCPIWQHQKIKQILTKVPKHKYLQSIYSIRYIFFLFIR